MTRRNLVILCLGLLQWPVTGFATETITIVAGGDIMLGRNLEPVLEAYGPAYPFSGIKSILRKADIAFANLESPISKCRTPYPREHHFPARPRYAASLQLAGFDVISLANNHSLDCGSAGLAETISHLRHMNIEGIGVKQGRDPGYLYRVKGKTITFFGYSMVSDPAYSGAKSERYNRLDESTLTTIRNASQKSDIVVVSIHWGLENTTKPYAGQITLAHKRIDAGAKIVLGHGSHTVQKVERYDKGLIFYSLGNLLFDQYGRVGNLASIRISDKKLDFDITPVQMDKGKVIVK